MVLAIDFGNTQIKTAVFECNTLINKQIISYPDWQKAFKKLLKTYPLIQNIVLASVVNNAFSDLLHLANDINCIIIDHQTKFPFTNLYTTPQTLGIDRMVLAAGAIFKFPGQNRLVIDLGTCITYDFIDKNNNYLGGAISPGIKLRYQALHEFTSKLPLLAIEMPQNSIGNSTNQAIHSGVVNGVIYEIEGFCNSYFTNDANFIIILTGGDSIFLANRLKNTIFANSNFLLESLNQTFQYNQND